MRSLSRVLSRLLEDLQTSIAAGQEQLISRPAGDSRVFQVSEESKCAEHQDVIRCW